MAHQVPFTFKAGSWAFKAAFALCVCAWVAGCDDDPQAGQGMPPRTGPRPSYNYDYDVEDYRTIKFKDDAASNTRLDGQVGGVSFTTVDGAEVHMKQYLGKKNVVLVITRGFTDSICVYCSTLTSRLILNYAKFADKDAEIVVVFPVAPKGDKSKVDRFLASSKAKVEQAKVTLPFPVVLDLDLDVVKKLGITADLSKPATYILDKQGKLRYAYVGESISDRPSIQAIVDQLGQL